VFPFDHPDERLDIRAPALRRKVERGREQEGRPRVADFREVEREGFLGDTQVAADGCRIDARVEDARLAGNVEAQQSRSVLDRAVGQGVGTQRRHELADQPASS